MTVKAAFFPTFAAWHAWLEKHHAGTPELWVGLHKRASGKPSITWPESVDGALCFGWIDGVRKRIDECSYMIRFTPRRSRSIWSAINVRRVSELQKLKLMRPAGLKAFEQRSGGRSELYSYEQRKTAKLAPELEQQFRANQKAWEFFESQPPGYRRLAAWWVISAKREDTRQRRLAQLIRDSRNRKRIGALLKPERK